MQILLRYCLFLQPNPFKCPSAPRGSDIIQPHKKSCRHGTWTWGIDLCGGLVVRGSSVPCGKGSFRLYVGYPDCMGQSPCSFELWVPVHPCRWSCGSKSKMWALLSLLSWFNPSWQLGTTQLLAHSPHPVGNGGENRKKVKLVGWDKDSLIGQKGRK